jgi:hypothetical protein
VAAWFLGWNRPRSGRAADIRVEEEEEPHQDPGAREGQVDKEESMEEKEEREGKERTDQAGKPRQRNFTLK